MDFTAAFRHASSRCLIFSPGSTFIASVTGDESNIILVRASSTLQVIRSWTLEVAISEVEWSRDGSFLLVTHPGQQEDGIVYILSLDPSKEVTDGSDDDRGWVAKIAAGSEGLVHATWTPPYGPRTLVMFSQNQLRALLFSLPDQTISSIEGPKKDKLIWSSKLPEYFATILKGTERDILHVFCCKKVGTADLKTLKVVPRSEELWKSETSFPLAMNDVDDVSWAPDGHNLAVWESPLEYKLQIYSPLGHLRATFLIEPDSNGEPVTRVGAGAEARTPAKQDVRARKESEDLPHIVAGGGAGIREVRWHPSSKFLAIGGWDEKIRILEGTEWAEICSFDTASKSIHATPQMVHTSIYGALIVWREPMNWLEETRARGIVALDRMSLPISPTALKVNTAKANAKVGIKWTDWSPEGNLLAVFNERLPYSVFIYAFADPEAGEVELRPPYLLSVLQLNSSVRTICWKPNHIGKLGVVCNNQAVFTWELLVNKSPDASRYGQRAEAVPIPTENFKATGVQWSFDGQKILLASDTLFCCAFEALEG